jgi:hypothetical protein
VLADRLADMIGCAGFGRREELGPDALSLTLQVGEDALSRRLVPAAGRDLDDDPVAVPVAGDVGRRFVRR